MLSRKLKFSLSMLGCFWLGCQQQVNPEVVEGIRVGDRNYRQGNWIGADEALTAAIRAEPYSPATAEAYYIRGLTRLKRGDMRAAETDFTSAAKLADREDLKANAQVCLGSIAYERESFAQAYNYYRSAVSNLPRVSPNDWVLYKLGISAQKVGEWDAAKRYLGRLIREYPGGETAQRARERLDWDYFTIQAGAFTNRDNALSRVEQLRRASLPAYREVRENGGKPVQVVYVGRYKDFKSAAESLDKVKRVVSDAQIIP